MIKTVKDAKKLYEKVEYCLKKYKQTRNCDIELTRRVWTLFYPGIVHNIGEPHEKIYLADLKSLPTQDDIKRLRAKIQNDEQRFIPTKWEVAKLRKWKEGIWRNSLGYPS